MRMLSSGLAADNSGCPIRLVATHTSVTGMSCPMPRAPLFDSAALFQPDSCHAIAIRRSTGRVLAAAHFSKYGMMASRSGMSTMRCGRPG